MTQQTLKTINTNYISNSNNWIWGIVCLIIINNKISEFFEKIHEFN